MKKIAIFSDGWGRKTTYMRCQGLYDRAKELDEDIAIHRFNCYGTWSHDNKYNQGEYNIFSLPLMECFDAVVIECNNTIDKIVLDRVYNSCRNLDIPIIDLTRDTGEFYYVGLNNKDAIIQQVEHLYNSHNCRAFVYVGGPEFNYENQSRELGFCEAMERYGIPVTDNMIYNGSWDIGCGKRAFDWIKENWDELPDAVVCANDAIAAGLCDEAEKCELAIPNDLKVTGFDNVDIATYFAPQISTTRHNYIQIGRIAMDIIEDAWNGKSHETCTLIEAKMIPAESCGCPSRGFVDNRRFMRRLVMKNEQNEYLNEQMALFEAGISDCKDFESVFMNVTEYISQMGCEGVFIVVDDRLYSASGDVEFAVSGYDRKHEMVVCAIEDGRLMHFPTFSHFEKHIDEFGRDSVYVYTPIHFRDKTIGYTIVKNTVFVEENSTFFNIQSIFTRKLEDLYNQSIIHDVNNKLKAVYNRDPLTGLYNRLAYTQYLEPEYEKYRQDNRVCAISFFDVDDFKNINDSHGHKYGDEVLRTIAVILDSNKPDGGIVYRFGGDEFVVFFPDATTEKIYKFQKNIESELMQSDIEISMGSVIIDPLTDIELDDYMILADEKMYEIKSEKKRKQL